MEIRREDLEAISQAVGQIAHAGEQLTEEFKVTAAKPDTDPDSAEELTRLIPWMGVVTDLMNGFAVSSDALIAQMRALGIRILDPEDPPEAS